MKIRISIIVLLALTFAFSHCSKDDGGSTTPEITVSTSDFSTTIAENPPVGTVLGNISGSTNSGSITFSLQMESVTGAFNLNSSNGLLTVADETLFDFETNPIITGTVVVANGSVRQTSNITITLTDLDESAPQTIWTGSKMTFTKTADADPAMAANQDRITDKVWLTRGNNGGDFYNVVTETESGSTSPAGTQWALGTTAEISSLTFSTLRQVGKPKDLVNSNLVLRLVDENIYIDLKILSWASGNNNNGQSGGGFSYERSTSN